MPLYLPNNRIYSPGVLDSGIVKSRLSASLKCTKMFWRQNGSGGGSAGNTWHHLFSANRSFYGVEIFYSNPTTAGTILYDSTAVAATANPTSSKITPTTGIWTVGGNVTVPAGTTIPIGVKVNSGIASTGFLACRSVDRSDGGTYPALMVRVYTSLGLPAYLNWGANVTTNWDSFNPDDLAWFASQSGDFTSTNQTGFTSTTRTGILVPIAIKYYYDNPGVTLLNIGDSIAGGDAAESGISTRQSYGYRACKLLRSQGYLIDHMNGGNSGDLVEEFVARGKSAITTFKPNIVTIPVWTPNSPLSTQAQVDAQWAGCMQLVESAIDNNVQPILITPTPQNGTTISTNGYRLSNRTRAMNSGYPYLDLEPLWSDGASPARWKSGLNVDATHPNAAANNIAAQPLADIIKSLL